MSEPTQEYPKCETCKWFRPTEESFGLCTKEPSEWPMHWKETWPQFGCIGHERKGKA